MGGWLGGMKLTALVGGAGLLGCIALFIWVKTLQADVAHEQSRYAGLVADMERQKAEAATLLATETRKVLERERELAALNNKVESDHVAASNAITAASAKYDRLGKLYEQTKARCGSGGSGTGGGTSPDAAVDHGGVRADGELSGPDERDSIGRVTADADRMREAVIACQRVGQR